MIAQLDAKRMPLTPVTIEPEERDVLLGWLREGAPATTPQSCEAPSASAAGATVADAAADDSATPAASSPDAGDVDAGKL